MIMHTDNLFLYKFNEYLGNMIRIIIFVENWLIVIKDFHSCEVFLWRNLLQNIT